jgi:hypothetical protein
MSPKLLITPIVAVTLAASAQAVISLEFRPLSQTVLLGDTVTVELWATTDQAAESFVAVDTALFWTNTIVNPISSHQGGGAHATWTSAGFMNNEMNQSLFDGNAFWTGLASFFDPAPVVTPLGLKVTNFTFVAIAPGTATLEMPALVNWPGRSQPFESKVYGPQNADITGTLAQTATINVVPEPGTLAALGLGAAAFMRRRKKS